MARIIFEENHQPFAGKYNSIFVDAGDYKYFYDDCGQYIELEAPNNGINCNEPLNNAAFAAC